MSAAPEVSKQSLIQVLSRASVAELQWSNGSWCLPLSNSDTRPFIALYFFKADILPFFRHKDDQKYLSTFFVVCLSRILSQFSSFFFLSGLSASTRELAKLESPTCNFPQVRKT